MIYSIEFVRNVVNYLSIDDNPIDDVVDDLRINGTIDYLVNDEEEEETALHKSFVGPQLRK